MIKDLNRGISKIQYNQLNLPQAVDILSPVAEVHNAYSYSANGVKLRVVQRYHSNFNTAPVIGSAINLSNLNKVKTTDYVGNKVFENNSLKRILVDGGYIEGGNYYFYLADHLGNNRVVIRQDGVNVQNTDYYPYGESMAHSSGDAAQPYKFGGKEYDAMHGLNLYDFSARMKSDWGFTTMDPLAEKYYDSSPYAYTANNPLRYIDPDGRDVWEVNDEGRIINRIKDKTQDAFYMVAQDADGNYQRTYTTDADGNKTYNSISFEYGTVESQRSISFSSDGKTTDTYDVYKVRGDDNGTQLFEFMSNHISGSSSGVEISQAMTGIAGDKGLNFITNGHTPATEPGMAHLLNGQLLHGYTIRELNHSHPYTPNPSSSDMGFASQVSNIMRQRNVPVPAFNLYYVPGKQKIPFGR